MTKLGEFIDRQAQRALSLPIDLAILDGVRSVGQPYEWGHTVEMSRGLALITGAVEPTPQERAVMATNRAHWRIENAAREVRRAEWFMAIQDVAGPVGAAILTLHVPDRYGDCEGCGFEELAGLPWPCATVLAGAEAAGIPEPTGI